jgi:PAS domain S-box-containing protein
MNSSASVLIIDDSISNNAIMRTLLEELNYQVFAAMHGKDGLEVYDRERPDIVLTDLDMPEMDGLTFICELNRKYTNVPVIVISGISTLSEGIEAVRRGAWDYLVKPVNINVLELTIRRSLERARLQAENLSYREHLEEQVRAQTLELQRERERYQRLLESVTSYVYTVTIQDGQPISTVHGNGCEAVTGFTQEEYAATPDLWCWMIHDEDRPEVLETTQRILTGTSPLTIRHRILHKNGTVRWVRNTLVPHRDMNGTLLYYDGVVLDITERKRAESALHEQAVQLEKEIAERQKAEESLLKFSHAVEQSPVSIVITDTKGSIQFVNPRFTQMTGYSAEEAIGKLMSILEPGYIQTNEHNELRKAISNGTIWEREFLNKKKNGESFWEHAVISPIRAKGGLITNFMVVKEDISERKHLEEQLRHAQKMEAIGQLAGGIAHDFNNILTVILGYGTHLKETIADDDITMEYVDQVLAAAERAANLTRSLLVFSHKQIMTPETVNLNDTVRNIERFLHRIIGEDVQLITSYTSEKLIVYADSGQLEQIVMNLATNARDAMPNGGVLSIETHLLELDEGFVQAYGYGEPGVFALLRVSDNGCGMDEETRQKIFDPFFSTKGVGKGTGLGLSIAFGIVRQHKGYISVFSEPNVGTTFQIMIPLCGGDVQAGARQSVSAPVGGSETILVAEDDYVIRAMVASNLSRLGYDVILAEDGIEAVNKFRTNRKKISLVILDMLMPGKNGWKAYKEIHRVRHDVRVLFMSGYNPDLIQSKGGSNFDSEILMKPFRPFELARKVREILDSRPSLEAGG